MSFPMGRCVAINLFLLAVLLLGPVRPAFPQEPFREDLPTFRITTANARGEVMTVFPPGGHVFYDIRFTLALSASDRYATTITLILDAEGTITEEILYKGALKEGHYRFTVPSKQSIGAGGERRYKIVFKTRFFPKKFTGKSFYVYRTVEGSYRIERRKLVR